MKARSEKAKLSQTSALKKQLAEYKIPSDIIIDSHGEIQDKKGIFLRKLLFGFLRGIR